MVKLPDALALHVYTDVTGFNPFDLATDNGTDPLEMWRWWQTNEIAGWRLSEAWPVDPQDEGQFRKAIETYPAVAIIMALALEQQNQRVWMPVGTPGSWGYHCVACDGFNGSYTEGSSWGHVAFADRSFVADKARVVAAWGLDIHPIT
jgi:hypothetical protein